MTRYVALVRAANVGGIGKLPMSELKSMCAEAEFARVETYIASGNVVFDSKLAHSKVKAALEARLHIYAGKSVGVIVRTAVEMAAVLKANPFPKPNPGTHTRSFSMAARRATLWITRWVGMTKRCASAIERFSFITQAAWGARSLRFRQPRPAQRAI